MHKKRLLSTLFTLLSIFSLKAQTFPFPNIPTDLVKAEDRGAFLVSHYWDNFNFADTSLIAIPELTEQAFSNFIDLLPRFDSISMERGVDAFAWRAFSPSVPDTVHHYFATLADHYLYDPNSPMRSDELYALFLRRMVSCPAFTEAERTRFAYQLHGTTSNAIGTLATDFEYIDRQGRRGTLHTTDGELLLLYFYDPDCDRCHAVTQMLADSPLLTDNPRLRVLAVYPDADTDEWRANKPTFPASWTDAYSPGGYISSHERYSIRATPTIYLLDNHKRVLLRDVSPEVLLQYLKEVATIFR